MVELFALLETVLSTRAEIHSFEVGVQVAILCLVLRQYISKEFAGSFTSVTILILLIVQPVPIIVSNLWYFLSGVLVVLGGLELAIIYHKYYTNSLRFSSESQHRN